MAKVVDISPDPVSFRVPASDTRGHSSRQWFRCQPGHAHQIETIVQGRRFPYRTKGDLLRHSLLRHLKYLETIGGTVPSVMAEVDAIIEVIRDEEFAQDFQQVFEKIGDRVASHMGQGAIGEARRLLLTIQGHVGKMPDGYWRDKYQSEIKSRYGHMLDNAPKASLRKTIS